MHEHKIRNIFKHRAYRPHFLMHRLIAINVLLSLIFFSFLLFIGYKISGKLYLQEIDRTYGAKFYALHSQVQSTLKQIQQLSDSLSQNELFERASEELSLNDKKLSAKTCAQIVQKVNLYKSAICFQVKIYIKIGPFVFNEMGVCDRSCPCAPVSFNQDLRSRQERTLLEEYVYASKGKSDGQYCFSSGLGDCGAVLCITDLTEQLKNARFPSLLVENNKGIVYRSQYPDNIESMVLPENDADIPNMFRKFSADKKQIVITYVPGKDIRYTTFINVSKLFSPVSSRALYLGGISLLLLAAFSILSYFTAQLVVSPIKQMQEVLDCLPDKELELSRFIFNIRRQTSLRRRIYRHHMCLLLPLILLTCISVHTYGSILRRQTELSFYSTTEQAVYPISNTVHQHIDAAKLLVFDQQFIQILRDLGTPDSRQNVQAEHDITQYIHSNPYLFTNTLSVSIFNSDGQSIYPSNESSSGENNIPVFIKKHLNAENFALFDKKNDSIEFSDFWFKLPVGNKEDFYVRFLVNDLPNVTLFENYNELLQCNCYIYDAMRWHIFYPAVQSEFDRTSEGILQGKILKNNEGRYLSLKKADGSARPLFAIRKDIPDTYFQLLFFIPTSVFDKNISILLSYNIFIFCAAILGTILMSSVSSAGMIRPIDKLQRIFDEAVDGSQQFYLPNFLDNELSMLANSFDSVLKRAQSLQQLVIQQKSRVSQLEQRRLQLELMALQAQLNPHFISNLFVSMRFMLREKKLDELDNTIKATGNFLREIAAVNETKITLKKEIELIRSYAYIQSIRFKGRIELEENISDDAGQQLVPKFLLQPIVENAVTHGMPSHGILHIKLYAWVQKGMVVIELSNDGIPIAPDKLEEIKTKLENGTLGAHVGLVNTLERVRLSYGDTYGVSVDSNCEYSTIVKITLPFQTRPAPDHKEE